MSAEHVWDPSLPQGLVDYLAELDEFIETEIKPLEQADDNIRCIIVTGSEKAFAAGADIKEMADKSYVGAYLEDFITQGWERVTRCRKPVIAAVSGYALGGG
ncbi:MAG: enoyl-CoA hydratase-related protein, partial [Ilumatobacteraceae bacterium]